MDGSRSVGGHAPEGLDPTAGRPAVYVATCVGIGAVLAWVPTLVHGPIPAKFDLHGLAGSIAVWAFYGARLLVGLWVGLTRWPTAWYWRGPLCGALSLLPVTFVSLAVPECGPT